MHIANACMRALRQNIPGVRLNEILASQYGKVERFLLAWTGGFFNGRSERLPKPILQRKERKKVYPSCLQLLAKSTMSKQSMVVAAAQLTNVTRKVPRALAAGKGGENMRKKNISLSQSISSPT